MFKFILDYVKGIAIGAGAILPGISSGVLCVIFGIYEKLLNSILGFFHDWKNNTKFLLPILLGAFTGIVLFGNILEFFFVQYPIYTKYCFIGLILGSLPLLLKQVNSKNGFRLHYIIYAVASFLFATFLLVLEKSMGTSEQIYCTNTFSFSFLLLAGLLMSAGVVIPGVSSTVILMLLGVYDVYLSAVSIVNISVLFPMAIGLCIGGFVFMKIIQKLLTSHPSETYYIIIGFVFGSIPILYPGFTFDMTGCISIICLLFCFQIGYLFERK